MVIKTSELEQKVIDNNLEQIKKLEELIDSTLVSKFVNVDSVVSVNIVTGDIGIYAASCKSYSRFTVNAVIEKYKQVGWEVEYNSCQKDGEWLSFKVRK